MPFTYRFQIDPEKIIVQDASSAYRLELPNRAVNARSTSSQALSVVLFGPGEAGLPHEIQLMENVTRLLHQGSQHARPGLYFLTKLVNAFDYDLSIPGYETFPAARRQAFEQSLQGHLRLRRLVINGQPVHIPAWRRTLEFWVRRLLVLVLPLVAMLVAYLNMPEIFATRPLPFLAFLLGVAYLTRFVGKLLWMALARWLVPGEYRLCMLQGTRPRLSRIDRFLARVLWSAG